MSKPPVPGPAREKWKVELQYEISTCCNYLHNCFAQNLISSTVEFMKIQFNEDFFFPPDPKVRRPRETSSSEVTLKLPTQLLSPPPATVNKQPFRNHKWMERFVFDSVQIAEKGW